MPKLDEERVDFFYEKLTGKKPASGLNLERRNFAQRIVFIEDVCRCALSAIYGLEHAPPNADIAKLEQALRTELKLLDTLHE